MKNLFLILILGMTMSLHAQKKIKFKNVSKEALSQEQHQLEPDANAAFLYNGYEGAIEYLEHKGFVYNYTIHQRIKVYGEDGRSWADFEIPLYQDHADREIVMDLDAFTYNLKNGKVEDTKLQRSDTYEEDVTEHWKTFKFAMPDVQPGSIVEVRYKIQTPFTFRIPLFYMQHDIPVDKASYEITIPEYYGYNPLIQGGFPLQAEKRTKADHLMYTSSSRESSTSNVVSRSKSRNKIDFQSNVYEYFGENIPAIKDEKYVHNIDNYKSAVAFELMYTKYPNEGINQYSTDWNKVAQTLTEHSSFGKAIERGRRQAKTFIETTSTDPVEIIAEIFTKVSKSFTWNGQGRVLSNGAKELLKEGQGSSADINLFLLSCLKEAGIEAYPLVSKTRDHGYLNIAFPVLADLNYVFVIAAAGDQYIYLDATTKTMAPGALPARALNLHAVLINGSEGQKIDITTPNVYQTTKYLKLEVGEEELTGEKTIKYGALNNAFERHKIASTTKDEYIQELNNVNEKLKVLDVNFKNDENPQKDLVSVQDVDYSEYCQKIDGKLFIPATLDLGLQENPFYNEERLFNIFFDEKLISNTTILFEIPEGYEVESIPEPFNIVFNEREIFFSLVPSKVNGGVAVNFQMQRTATSVMPEQYEEIRKFYEEVVKKSKEMIVLVKKT